MNRETRNTRKEVVVEKRETVVDDGCCYSDECVM